ncbi:MAG: UPF0236 family protein, partial [Lentisphaerota bacterium]
MTIFGEIEARHNHCINKSGGPFKMSSYLQETVCYIGQNEVFEEGEKTFQKLRGITICAKQIERVSHYYGNKLEEKLQDSIAEGRPYTYTDKTGRYYAMVDGSMLLTREEKWKEIKLGRIFNERDNIEINKGRKTITKSLYVSHLGGHNEFTKKMEYYLDSIKNLVFIADGAKWIWNWISAVYPDSIQILDYFHAKEHLCDFAKAYFNDVKQSEKWIDEQCQLLLNDKVKQVIKNIQHLPHNTKTQSIQSALVQYYKTNSNRMMYKTFSDEGVFIGSGAIESAHKHVLQQRLKLSGQRWTSVGLQQVANLRVAFNSDQWNQVIEF